MKLISGRKVLLKDLVTFKIGGPCEHFIEVFTLDGLRKALDFSKEKNLPYLILGEGSNLLVSDAGFSGVVIKMSMKNYRFERETLIAEAGVYIGELVEATIQKELSGLEWAGGLPGSLGGSIRGNAGAFGKCMADAVTRVTYMEPDGEIKVLSRQECKFRYRDSFFKHSAGIITQAEISLVKGNGADIKEEIFKNISYRVNRHPLDYPNVGSIFKNINDPMEVLKLISLDPKTEELLVQRKGKISTAYLIESVGLKGKRIGGAQVSFKHANFIVNKDGATAEDVLKLIKLIKDEVYKKFNVSLELEVQFVGFDSDGEV